MLLKEFLILIGHPTVEYFISSWEISLLHTCPLGLSTILSTEDTGMKKTDKIISDYNKKG